ncbi:hypothetical protein H920_05637 [Fukomys damarensis]|uniref:Uncharacterized protein n=1 Tax=Fukomys damarensis TaxID=885580 RepID=A0A091ECH2_FUKDA|nr:hypothetical protein H920_05637 [Fukomys damarensis]
MNGTALPPTLPTTPQQDTEGALKSSLWLSHTSVVAMTIMSVVKQEEPKGLSLSEDRGPRSHGSGAALAAQSQSSPVLLCIQVPVREVSAKVHADPAHQTNTGH